MVRRSAPSSNRCVAYECLLCLARHSRHYVPFLTMSCNRSRAQYLRLLQEEGNDIVFIHSISPVPVGTRPS
jgi:hypothetical protein